MQSADLRVTREKAEKNSSMIQTCCWTNEHVFKLALSPGGVGADQANEQKV